MDLLTRTPGGYFKAWNATLTGDLTVGADTSFWFSAAVRGDVAPIVIGRRVSVQDCVVIHADENESNTLGDDIIIGHGAIVHGREVGSGSLIGMGSTILNRTHIGRHCIIAAGCVVPPGMKVPDRSLVMGVPGKIVRDVTDKDIEYIQSLVKHYVELGHKYVSGEITGVKT
jgi:carbonic anhydrase/acetyltransferase-like protein (isoleucine patch superfamily)